MISSQQLGQRIADARRARNLTQAQLAEGMGLARTTVVAIEKGERRPSNDEIVRIAGILGTAVHDFVREHRVTANISPRFRLTGVGHESHAGTRDAVGRLRILAARYVELERMLDAARPPALLESIQGYRADVVRVPANLDASAAATLYGQNAARDVRQALGLGDAPALELEELFELGAGFRQFNLDMPAPVAAVLLWGDEIGACVAVNSLHPHERRRWSLCHELAHVLRDREQGDVLPTQLPKRRDPAEVFAESFAQEFLMPGPAIARRFTEQVRATGRFTPADIIGMARLYETSFEAMTRRLEDLELLPAGTHDRLVRRKFRPTDAAASIGLAREKRERPSLLPERYVSLAVTAFDRALLSETELAEYLQTDRVTARQVAQERRHSELDDGAFVELDLGNQILGAPGDA